MSSDPRLETNYYFYAMLHGKKIVVVLPAYNAEKTLKQTYDEIDKELVDAVILVDDASNDQTYLIAQQLGIKHIIKHEKNLGYGGNQKSCYNKALEIGADIIIMLHPDYQYDPKLLWPMSSMVATGLYPVVLASRILGKGALKGGMPYYKYLANRFLTFFQNIWMNEKLSEYHSGYRAYAREVLEHINYNANDNDFVFDNQVLSQIVYNNYRIGEISCPTKYFKEASSINFRRSVKYGLGVLATSIKFRFQRWGLIRLEMYKARNDL